jgi:hypothetical protein
MDPKRSIPLEDFLHLLYLTLLASALEFRGFFLGSGLGLDGCGAAIASRALRTVSDRDPLRHDFWQGEAERGANDLPWNHACCQS